MAPSDEIKRFWTTSVVLVQYFLYYHFMSVYCILKLVITIGIRDGISFTSGFSAKLKLNNSYNSEQLLITFFQEGCNKECYMNLSK